MSSWIIQSIFLGTLAGLIPSPHTYFCHEAARSNKKIYLASALIIGILIDLSIVSLVKFIKPSNYSLVLILSIGTIYFSLLARKLYFSTEISNENQFSFYSCIKSHLLNPNPYLFWLSIGSIYLGGETENQFVASFLVTMVIVKLFHIKILLILEKKIIKNKFFLIRNKVLSIAFLALSSKFILEGIRVIQHAL